jgi:hypothetical protein
MATKVGEVAALRRAFDVAAPTAEERWDIDQSDLEPAPKAPTLAERVAEETAKIRPPAISAADFKAWYTESGISEEYAQGVARSLWPEQTGKLNDEQRAILKRRLEEAPDAEKLIADAFGS